MNITKNIFNQLKEYQNSISEQLIAVNKEKKELIEKVDAGETLTKKESKRNKNLTSKIKLLQETFTLVDKLIQTKEFETNFRVLNSKATVEEKNYAKNILLGIIKNVSTTNVVGIENLAKMPENLDENLDNMKKKIEDDLKTLNADLAYAKRRSKAEEDILAIEADIEDKKNDLDKVNKYLDQILSDKDIRKNLNDYEVATKNAKGNIKKKYIKLLNDYQERIIESIEKNQAQINALDKSKLTIFKEKFIDSLKEFSLAKPFGNEEYLDETETPVSKKDSKSKKEAEENNKPNDDKSAENNEAVVEDRDITEEKLENNESHKKNIKNTPFLLIVDDEPSHGMKSEGKILIMDNQEHESSHDMKSEGKILTMDNNEKESEHDKPEEEILDMDNQEHDKSNDMKPEEKNNSENDKDLDEDYEDYEENNISEFLKKYWKKLAAITATAIGVVAIVVACKQFSKNVDNSDKDFSKDNSDILTSSIESIETESSKTYDDKILALMEKGYGEYEAGLMFQNFDDELINKLLDMPYIAKVENYVTTQDFNIDYLEDYENVRTINNVTSKQAVDYVNRSYKIQEANFYPEASIDEVAKIVMAFGNGKLYTEDFSYVLHPIDSTINEITNNYRFGTIQEEDIKKIEALQYFAKEDTDLSSFLKRYSKLAADVLRNPYDGAKKDQLYSFLTIYATSLNNGFINELDVRTDDEEFNNDAILNSYYDFQVAYDGFVQSTIPLLIPSVNEPGAYQNYVDTTGRTQKSIELQELLLTAINNNTINCEKGRTLGGE